MDRQQFHASPKSVLTPSVQSEPGKPTSPPGRRTGAQDGYRGDQKTRRPRVAEAFRHAFVVGLVLIQMIGVSSWQSTGVAAQGEANTYTDPAGRFTMQWQAPWGIVRQDENFIMLSNGGPVAVGPIGSLPIGSGNLDSCLPALIEVTADPNETSYPVLAKGKTTWRSWIAYQNDSVGLGDYFECQVLPDGNAVAVFIGVTTLSNFASDIAVLTDFVGHTIIQPNGEHAPALTGGGWRVGVVTWSREAINTQLGLPAKESKDWVIAVVDVTNQQAASEEISLKSFGVRDIRGTTVYHASVKDSNALFAALGEAPIDGASTITIPRGAVRRSVLVFSVEKELGDLAFVYGKQELLLRQEPGFVRYGILHPPTLPVVFEPATVDKVVDGRTVRVTLGNTGESATVQLLGLDVPVGKECYAAKAKKKLAKLVGTSVLLEADDAVPDGKRLSRHVWSGDGSLLLSNELVRLGYATATNEDHRFQAMLSASETRARGKSKGLWTDCLAAAPQTPVATPGGGSPPTPTDRAYLSSLPENVELLHLSLASLTQLLQDGAISEPEMNQLAWVFIGLGTAEKDIRGTPVPARYESLQAAYLTALEPLTTQARAEADLDAFIYGDASSVDFYDLEIDAGAMILALGQTTALLAEADAQFEAAQKEAG